MESFRKEIQKEFMETLKMSRTEMMCKAKSSNQKQVQMIEKNASAIKENLTDSNKKLEAINS